MTNDKLILKTRKAGIYNSLNSDKNTVAWHLAYQMRQLKGEVLKCDIYINTSENVGGKVIRTKKREALLIMIEKLEA